MGGSVCGRLQYVRDLQTLFVPTTLSAILFVTLLCRWQSSVWGGYPITRFPVLVREPLPVVHWRVSHLLYRLSLINPNISKWTEMSIETLLEAARFLELQAQQQQNARGKFTYFIYIL